MRPGTLLKTDKCTIAVETAPLDAPDAAALYPWKFALSRPDQHVAWRGDAVPPDPLVLIDRIRGAGSRQRRAEDDGRPGRQIG
jgi:hypothetical protein